MASSHHRIRQPWINLTRNIARWKRERLAGRAAGDRIAWPNVAQLMSAGRSATPALIFGLRLWTAVCLALYVAFWLQLDDAQWAGISAAIICQPSVGASLRKGSARMVGTAIGAVAIVILTAFFPQSRSGFLLGLALWGAACGFVATILANNASYAAALAGYHGGDHCQRLARADRRRQRLRAHPCDQSRQRNLHWHRLCGHCSCRNRFRRRAASAGRAIRRRRGGDHQAICRHPFLSGAGAVGDAAGSARARSPGHRTGSRYRRGDRRDLRPALSLARLASGCRRPVCSDLRLACSRHQSRADAR